MPEIFRTEAPAKINLSLKVLRRREDGFHELETRMCPISLCDTVELKMRESGGIELHCDDPDLPLGDDNLAIKAVRAFESASEIEIHAEMSIAKRIPSGAGMGGGSSDAAAVLRLLNQATKKELPISKLAVMAAEIGSDVPFFLFGQCCDASGRGEIIRPVDFPHKLDLLLIKPPFGVSTPWAYSRWKDSIENPNLFYAAQQATCGELVNDLERPVFEKHLVLGDLKRWLLEQDEVEAAMMSGSGATVFAILKESTVGETLRARALAEFGETFWSALAMATSRPG